MRNIAIIIGLLVALTSCVPGVTTPAEEPEVDWNNITCKQDVPPVLAVVDFENVTGGFGITITGVETAANARMITLLKRTGCYEVVEKSTLQKLIEDEEVESTDPIELAKAAGAGYVITGTVTRATIDEPNFSMLGVSVGVVNAQIEVDVRATDILTGEIVVSMTGVGNATDTNVEFNPLPFGSVAYENSEYSPLLADASANAISQVTQAIVQRF